MSTMKIRDTPVLGRVGVGASDQDPELGMVGARGPDLLTVDNPFIAVPDCSGGERGQIRPGAGLAEELAPDLLTGEQRPQIPLLLLGGAVFHQRRTHECLGRGDEAGSWRRSFASSWLNTIWCAVVRPRPPNVSGQVSAAQPFGTMSAATRDSDDGTPPPHRDRWPRRFATSRDRHHGVVRHALRETPAPRYGTRPARGNPRSPPGDRRPQNWNAFQSPSDTGLR